jgi:hypothetical protein
MGQVYYDDQRKKYVHDDGEGNLQEFPEKPGVLDTLKEGFLPTEVRVQLDVERKRREGNT